jgi:hypothetical protein
MSYWFILRDIEIPNKNLWWICSNHIWPKPQVGHQNPLGFGRPTDIGWAKPTALLTGAKHHGPKTNLWSFINWAPGVSICWVICIVYFFLSLQIRKKSKIWSTLQSGCGSKTLIPLAKPQKNMVNRCSAPPRYGPGGFSYPHPGWLYLYIV